MDAGSSFCFSVSLRPRVATRAAHALPPDGSRSRTMREVMGSLAMLPFLLTMTAAPLFAGNAPDLMPDTSIAPADTGSAPVTPPATPRHTAPARNIAPSASEEPENAAPPAPVVHHHATPRPSATPIPNLVFEVEPCDARVLLRNDADAYLQPSKQSPIVEQLQAGKFVHATGMTHFFLQIKLKNSSVAYVLADNAYLTVAADKIFRLTADAGVLTQPNKWAKQVAIVHQGHDVHVIGVALSYMKIQMKSGLVGYIPIRALE
jgi:hypothetical protein